MLGVRSKTVNRMLGRRFESATTLCPRLSQVAVRSSFAAPRGGHRHCPPLRSVLKCSNGRADSNAGAGQKDDFRGTGGIAAADSFGGRIARTAAAGGAF